MTERAANKRATGEYVRFTLPWGRHQLPPEGVEWARRMTPTGTYLLVRALEPLLRPSFRKLETAAFGHSSSGG